MREDGTYDAPTFRERLHAIDCEIAAVQAEPEKPRTIGDLDLEGVTAAAAWFLPRLRELWRQISPSSRSRFGRLVFPDGLCCDLDGALRTTKPGLILALIDPENDDRPDEVHPSGVISNKEQEYQYFLDLLAFHRECNDNATLSQDRAA